MNHAIFLAWCGTVGHKPTHGLVPYTGAFPIEFTLDHLGPITRTMADAALMLSVIAGRDGWDPRQPADLRPDDYVAALGRDVAGLRAGVVSEGFGIPDLSEPGVDDTVRAAAARLREVGMQVDEVSVPWHRHAMHVWNVIATDGATVQMVDGNGYGWNWDGLYDPELIAYYGRQRREVADAWSETVKLVVLGGRPPGHQRPGRPGGRSPGRHDDRRQAVRRRHLPPRGPCLRDAVRRLPRPARPAVKAPGLVPAYP